MTRNRESCPKNKHREAQIYIIDHSRVVIRGTPSPTLNLLRLAVVQEDLVLVAEATVDPTRLAVHVVEDD